MSNYVNDMTNEEIWEMLGPKMVKNGLKKKMGGLHIGKNLVDGFWVYTPDDAHKAIALAYKVGYLRSQKGRPFKIGEKKKKKGGHWEPVDTNNLPKEGTKVKYSKECKNNIFVKLGQEGLVSYLGKELGMLYYDREAQSLYWVNFYGVEKCLDVWVEDNE